MKVNSITFERLSYLQQYYSDPISGIPEESGVYYWVHWPEFDPKTISASGLVLRLTEYTEKSLSFTEKIIGKYKFEVEVKEQSYKLNGNAFGLTPSKTQKLTSFFNTPVNRTFFSEFFKELCFSRPFYVGKANNLRQRLVKQHFKGQTEILPEINRNNITATDIWVGYKIMPTTGPIEINNIIEEIFSRSIKPGLTKKPN